MQISVIKKRFLLAGFETAMAFGEGFEQEMERIRSELKRSLDRIGNKVEPVRPIGFCRPWLSCVIAFDPVYVTKTKTQYFFGVEVSSLDDIPSDCVVKAVPESCYAVCRDQRRGTGPKADMFAVPGYDPRHELAGDLEIFDDTDHIGKADACDLLVPVKSKE